MIGMEGRKGVSTEYVTPKRANPAKAGDAKPRVYPPNRGTTAGLPDLFGAFSPLLGLKAVGICLMRRALNMRRAARRGRMSQRCARARRYHRSSRGQSLVEFALVLPFLLVLVLGAVDYGRAYFDYISVTSAARTAAFYASAGPESAADTTGIRNAALQEMVDVQGGTAAEVTVATGPDAGGRTYARVTVRHTFDTLFTWPLLPNTLVIQRSVQMRVAP